MSVRFWPRAQRFAILPRVDPEIEELKELVKQDLAISADTNRAVHKIRRGANWGRLFQFIWWAAIIAVSGAAYYLYLQPYVAKVEALYGNMQQTSARAQTFENQVVSFVKSHL
jgi:hypothetical protein